ncbi:MAG: sensor domain-containing diguanylate cyclase [Candidatus Izimaplasma sp.]|nr:sensor domain-containing diguanylate cyclase [Candidatus Izimaplasma bacterium]
MNEVKLIEHLFEAAYVVDNERKILACNGVFEKITGFSKEDVVGKYCYENILRHVTDTGKQLCHDGCPLHDSIMKEKINTAKVYLHHKKGYRVPVQVRTIPFKDEKTGEIHAIEFFTDYMKESKIYKENRKLKENLMTDELTQVHNRKFMDYQIGMSINEYVTFKTPMALLFIDIDHFKSVNDTYGHDVGDRVLKSVAKSLSLNIRNGDFVGRFGGEEFIVLLRDVSKEEMVLVAEKLRSLINNTNTYLDNNKPISVTISVGAIFYNNSMSKEELIKEADTLMYQAKQSGRNKVRYR